MVRVSHDNLTFNYVVWANLTYRMVCKLQCRSYTKFDNWIASRPLEKWLMIAYTSLLQKCVCYKIALERFGYTSHKIICRSFSPSLYDVYISIRQAHIHMYMCTWKMICANTILRLSVVCLQGRSLTILSVLLLVTISYCLIRRYNTCALFSWSYRFRSSMIVSQIVWYLPRLSTQVYMVYRNFLFLL